MKKLPKLYKNQNNIPNNNQEKMSIGKFEEEINLNEENVNKKISNIFNSPKYVYKADVKIIKKDGEELKKTIIGRTNNSIITIDDELINVNDIVEINFLN